MAQPEASDPLVPDVPERVVQCAALPAPGHILATLRHKLQTLGLKEFPRYFNNF